MCMNKENQDVNTYIINMIQMEEIVEQALQA